MQTPCCSPSLFNSPKMEENFGQASRAVQEQNLVERIKYNSPITIDLVDKFFQPQPEPQPCSCRFLTEEKEEKKEKSGSGWTSPGTGNAVKCRGSGWTRLDTTRDWKSGELLPLWTHQSFCT
ncbi:hypothetical protein niasHT_027796 [Heterodera trifolii]|uniref:Uncharacterized protein n=1 Tax=Heterodera trifolii TaxID=157864 RepID=A0ABD2JFN2_9BILA